MNPYNTPGYMGHPGMGMQPGMGMGMGMQPGMGMGMGMQPGMGMGMQPGMGMGKIQNFYLKLQLGFPQLQ